LGLNESHRIKYWENKHLEELVVKMSNGTTATQIESVTPYPVTRIETISDGKINPKKVKFIIAPTNVEKYRLKAGDILFSHINSIEHIGKTALYENQPEFLLHGMNLLLLRSNLKKVDYFYLFQFLNWEITRNKFRSMAKKAVNQASINTTELGSLIIPVPPLVEQRGIAEVLGTVDEAIRRTDAVIEKAEELKRGLMQRLLTRGIGHTEFKKTELGEIPKTWETLTIEELCQNGTIIEIQDGNHGEKHPKSNEYVSYGIPFITANCIVKNKLDFTKCNFLKKERTDLLRIGFSKENDVLLTHKGSIGFTAIVPATKYEYIMLSPQVTYYRLNEYKINKFFLYYVFQSEYFQNAIRKISKQSTRDYVGITNQRKLPFIYTADIGEQKQIINNIQESDKLLDVNKSKRAFLTKLKQGLMQSLLSGKIRVELRVDGLHRIIDC
jgi:type I restriction enzyme S subunit